MTLQSTTRPNPTTESAPSDSATCTSVRPIVPVRTFTVRHSLTCTGTKQKSHPAVTLLPQPLPLTGAWCGVCGRDFQLIQRRRVKE